MRTVVGSDGLYDTDHLSEACNIMKEANISRQRHVNRGSLAIKTSPDRGLGSQGQQENTTRGENTHTQ